MAEEHRPPQLEKAPSGIKGLDQITGGGLPRGRPTLICGSAGCGKTLLAIEFLVRGATEFGEPGVFVAFEETREELAENVASLGFDLGELAEREMLRIDHVQLERSEIEFTGEYDLEALFIRLAHAVDAVGAKRIVLDTIESLFGGLENEAILRAELRRLFRWLKARRLTAIVTAERGSGALTKHGLEEYVSDCVILLDQRVEDQIATRRMRIIKYRGSFHGLNEYPFLIDERGFSVLPLSLLGLDHAASDQRISTGVERLDAMLGGRGYFAGSSVLVSGTAGTGKSTIAAHFADATCRAGGRVLYFAFEESPAQIARNMRSLGIDLQPWLDQGRLEIKASRPTMSGLELHLVEIHRAVRRFHPDAVIVDPISNFLSTGTLSEVKSMLARLIDILKSERITGMFTNLTVGGEALDATQAGVSSLMDTWILLSNVKAGAELKRTLTVLKSRGMAHSNRITEFRLGEHGLDLREAARSRERVGSASP
jgi:circadian clock protein KaiC